MTPNNYPEGFGELAISVAKEVGRNYVQGWTPQSDFDHYARALLDAMAERGYVLVDAKKQEVIHQVWQKFRSWKDCDEDEYNASPSQNRRVLYAQPVVQEQAAMHDCRHKGIESIAAMIEKKANDYADEFGYSDMGALSFGSGAHAAVKDEYHSGILELAEEVRTMVGPLKDRV